MSKKKKREGVILIVVGLKTKGNNKFMLEAIKKQTRKYASYVLSVLEEEPFREFVSNHWAKDQLLQARAGKIDYANAAKYLVFKPDWRYKNKYLNKEPPEKIRKKHRLKVIKEIAKVCHRAIFFIQWGSNRKENLYQKLKAKGLPCKTIYCPKA